MNKISVITSFNDYYYNLIGKYCVSSFLKNWPNEINLTCYVEDCKLEDHERIEEIPFSDLSPTYFEFQQSKFKDRVKTFAKKGYSIIHAMENIECDRLIWIDADVITHKPMSFDFIDTICSDSDLATFMGVVHEKENKRYFSCESSFFILNKRHNHFTDFRKRYREYYDDKITDNLRRFYDGEVLGATIKDLEHLGNMKDLNPSTAHKTPMGRSILKNNFIHYKAGLKEKSNLDFDIEHHLDSFRLLSLVQ
jgi:hypothetical protein